MKIGFIGQGWIGKNYADNFEERGYDVVRYSLEAEYVGNRKQIGECDIIFIAVPTPSTPAGFDTSYLVSVLDFVGPGKIAVIKSTVLPGITEKLQRDFPNIIVLHSPEFLTEATAKYDAAYPKRSIVGYVNIQGEAAAAKVMRVLPNAPYKAIMPARAAELVKYGGNCWFYFKVIFINMLYDLAQKLGVDYETVKEAMSFDNRIGFTHLEPRHHSGRGAGGHCFIKDFKAFADLYGDLFKGDKAGNELLYWAQIKNLEFLISSNKDLDLVDGVYGLGKKIKQGKLPI